MVTALGKLCAQMAYAAAGVRFKDTDDWAPSPRAALRMVDVLPNALARFDKHIPGCIYAGSSAVWAREGAGRHQCDLDGARTVLPNKKSY
jgi:hypothetical protein